jgi:glycerol-3-phosphate acyltransferase PlsY
MKWNYIKTLIVLILLALPWQIIMLLSNSKQGEDIIYLNNLATQYSCSLDFFIILSYITVIPLLLLTWIIFYNHKNKNGKD